MARATAAEEAVAWMYRLSGPIVPTGSVGRPVIPAMIAVQGDQTARHHADSYRHEDQERAGIVTQPGDGGTPRNLAPTPVKGDHLA